LKSISSQWVRRAGYVLLALAAVNLVVGTFFMATLVLIPAESRPAAITPAAINLGFAFANGLLGFAFVVSARRLTGR